MWATVQAMSRLAHAGCLAERPSRDGVQRPPLRPGAHAAGGTAAGARLRRGTSGPVAWHHAHIGRPPSHRLPRSGRRTAGRGLRARARVRARPAAGPPVAPGHVNRAQDDRQLLHAARGHRLPRPPHAGPAGRGRLRRRASSSCASSIRRWAVAHSWWPRAAISPNAPSRRWWRRANGRRATSPKRTARTWRGRLRSSVSTASTAIPPPCSSLASRYG